MVFRADENIFYLW